MRSKFILLFAAGLAGVAYLARGEGIAVGAKAPEFAGKSWLNTTHPLSIAGLKGRVILLHFWTFGCINCRHNLPAYGRLQKEFADSKVTMIGIHTPETAEERDVSNVSAAIKRLNLKFPVLVDSDGRNWHNYKQQFWPTLYLIDKHGRVRESFEGELNYDGENGEAKVSRAVTALLQER